MQENFDNCGKWKAGASNEIEYDYVPVTGGERLSATLSYGADRLSNGNISSSVNKDVFLDGAFQGRLRFTSGCWNSQGLDLRIDGLLESDATSHRVTVRIDDQAEVVEVWHSWNENGRQMVSPRDDLGLLQRLKGASSVTFTVEGSDLTPVTFDLTGVYDTPIQGNLDNCGMYKQGETRELEQPESSVITGRINDPDGESVIDWNLSPSGGTVPITWTRQFVFDTELEVYLVASCSPTGATFIFGGTRFGDLSDDQVEVVWSVDGGAEQLETWQVVDYFGSR